MYKKGPKRNRA